MMGTIPQWGMLITSVILLCNWVSALWRRLFKTCAVKCKYCLGACILAVYNDSAIGLIYTIVNVICLCSVHIYKVKAVNETMCMLSFSVLPFAFNKL